MSFQSGVKTTFDDTTDHKEDLANGLDFLDAGDPSIAFLKRIGTNGFTAKSTKHEWTETALAVREETITIDGSATTLTVANANQYQKNEIIRCENEVMRITAIPSSTTLTVVRGYGGTTAAAHTSKIAFSMGSADPENSVAPDGIADNATKLYNYTQTFTRAVQLSNDEIATMSTEGNPLTGQKARRFIEINRLLAKAVLYGNRHEDTANKIRSMGGLSSFIQTNVLSAGAAITVSTLEDYIEKIVVAGGNPGIILCSPYQKRKLSDLDANLQRIGKRTHTGGALNTKTWQSAVLGKDLDIIMDHSVKNDEIWVLDPDMIKVGHLTNNGVKGAFHVEDATVDGQDGKHHVIRGKYTLKVKNEKGMALIKDLS